MADREISTLPAAEELQDEDLFVVRQNGEARKSTAAQLKTLVDTDMTDEQMLSMMVEAGLVTPVSGDGENIYTDGNNTVFLF